MDFEFSVTAMSVARGSAAAVVATATEAVKKAFTGKAAKETFWKKVAVVIEEKKEEIAEAIAEKMTEVAKASGKTVTFTKETVLKTVDFDTIASTVENPEFAAAAAVAPVIATTPTATPPPTGAAHKVSGMQIIASLLVAVATCSLA
jgi:dihydrodipicolinate reductase